MIDFADARATMVEGQVRTNDVTDPRIHAAMSSIPRELFVPKGRRALAYMGESVQVGDKRFLMDPRSLSKLLQGLDLKSTDIALDIGCGTGYSSAVLASICDAVVALESNEQLADTANDVLTELGILNAAVVNADLAPGCPEQGPFDVILVSGGVEFVPEAWTSQLSEGGRLGVIVTEKRVGHARLYVRTGDTVSEVELFDALVPVLPGFEKTKEFAF